MTMIFPLVVALVLFAVIASLGNEGLWGNLINLVNLVTAALVATNFFEPLAGWLTTQMAWTEYLADFVTVWLLFMVTILLLGKATSGISKTRVKFLKQLETPGSWLMAVVCAWVFVCFAMMTLHTAPLARNFLWGGFKPEDRMIMGTSPDRLWLGYMLQASQGPFARSPGPDDKEDAYWFDPNAEFMIKYASRRKEYNTKDTFTGTGTGT